MRHIKKSKEPQSLTTFKSIQVKNFIPTFESLPPHVVQDIFNALMQDQGCLCCYCQSEITADTARLVQFVPAEDEALQYTNLYLACNYSNNLPPLHQHCYIKKGTDLIPKYIADENCADYFRYNTLGEIVPAGEFRTIRKCQDNYRKLTPVQQAVLSAIDILNLNAERLCEQRKAIYTQVASLFSKAKKDQINEAIKKFGQKDKNGKLKRFCDVIIYYLRTL